MSAVLVSSAGPVLPSVGFAAGFASVRGASGVLVRRSRRSLSGWVVFCAFPSSALAGACARRWAGLGRARPFVRRAGPCSWSVSVPVVAPGLVVRRV